MLCRNAKFKSILRDFFFPLCAYTDSKKIGFEGGQMPLQRRIPKFGFKNINRKEYRVINLDTLQNLVKSKKINKEISIEKMIDLDLANKNDSIKILGRGKLETPLKIFGHFL